MDRSTEGELTRLRAELVRMREREAATREILDLIRSSRDDETPVFEAVLRNAQHLCNAEGSVLLLGRPSDTHLKLAAYHITRSDHHASFASIVEAMKSSPIRMDPSEHFAAAAIISGKTAHVTDLARTPGYLAGEPTFRAMVDQIGVKSLLAVPLCDEHGALGAINLGWLSRKLFDEDELALVQTFAAQAVIAIENVRQFKALETLNTELGERVDAQVGEIKRMGRLKRFLPSAVADAVVSSGSEKLLSSHRALLGVLFCDIRGFTAFCETAEPEETIEVLQTYHEEMGKLINAHGAGVDYRMGDGIMVLFNDPLPCDDPAGSAVRLAIAMRARMADLCAGWKRLGHRLGFGVGVSLGYATVGMVGFEERFDYTASGTAINLAARLCDEAENGEILLSPRARIAVEEAFEAELRGEFSLKGIREPVEVFRLSCTVPI